MCVSKAARGEAEPSSVQAALTNNPMPGTVDLGIDVTAGQFVVDVMVASKERQCELDQAAVRGGARYRHLRGDRRRAVGDPGPAVLLTSVSCPGSEALRKTS